MLSLVERAVAARVSLVQLREKNLTARTLYELTIRAAAITHGSATRLLVNDRADIAAVAGADGVHLTTQSLDAALVRRIIDPTATTRPATDATLTATGAARTIINAGASNSIPLIGVSTHTLDEARAARDGGADFAVFGPVFETPSKRVYGAPPPGLPQLSEAARALAPFPLLALGGVTVENACEVLRAGAQGIAAIRLFAGARELRDVVRALEDAGVDCRPDETNDDDE